MCVCVRMCAVWEGLFGCVKCFVCYCVLCVVWCFVQVGAGVCGRVSVHNLLLLGARVSGVSHTPLHVTG